MDKQKEILNAALKLFTEFGFHGTPTSKIAQEAGVANGTLFHYYKTKDELIVALYVDIKKKLGYCVSKDEQPGETIKEQAKRNYIAALKWGLENEKEFLFMQQFLSSPYMLQVPPEVLEQSQAMLKMIQNGINEKVIKVTPATYVMSLISNHIYGVSQFMLTQKMSAAKQKQFALESFELLWKMIT